MAKMYKDKVNEMSRYMEKSGSKIKNDYTKHANVPQDVIIEDMGTDREGMNEYYDDTPEGMQKQMMHDRKKTMTSKPRSRY